MRKDEKGAPVVFYMPVARESEDETIEETNGKARFFARTSKVFNSDQVAGYSPPQPASRSLVEIIQHADDLVASTGADIRHGEARAFYQPLDDYIQMPEQKRFIDTKTGTATENYYAILFHERAPWTGHETRLDRDLAGRFGDQSYAMEEFVAEVGAAFLCADLGVTNSPRPDHAANIVQWLQIMKRDSKAVFTAASKASQAAGYLEDLSGTARHRQ